MTNYLWSINQTEQFSENWFEKEKFSSLYLTRQTDFYFQTNKTESKTKTKNNTKLEEIRWLIAKNCLVIFIEHLNGLDDNTVFQARFQELLKCYDAVLI